MKKYVSWGAGPRASQYLILGAKARAAMDGRRDAGSRGRARRWRCRCSAHRVVLNFQAEAEGVKVEDLVERVRRATRM